MMELDTGDKNRLSQSMMITAVCWLVLLILLAVIPVVRTVPEEREFPEVRITLADRSPEPEKVVETASPRAEKTETVRPVRKKADTSRKDTATAGKAAAQTSPASVSSGLGIPDFNNPSGTSEPAAPSGEYLDFSSERPREQTVKTAGPSVHEFEGSAARVESPRERPGTPAPEAGSRVSAASDETLQALDRIRDGTTGGDSGPAEAAPAPARVKSTAERAGTGSSSPITFDGVPRRLLYPDGPVIILPPHLSRLIESDRAVTVHFTVRADGSVPASLISFTPSALLPPEVQNYLRNEFMTWRFERGTSDGQARFVYSIKVQ